MRDYRWIIIFVILIPVLAITFFLNTKNEKDTIIRTENSINIDNDDLAINWRNYPYSNISLSSAMEITQSGTYHLTGILYDGGITVKPDKGAVVRLILDNATINNSNGPAIACYSGEDLVIELNGENTIIDGANYASTYDEDVTGNIYSKTDLTFQGDGKLTLTGNHADGIVSKDDLTFRDGTYNITAQDDAIRGKDSVHITNGNFIIESVADSIKSTNDTDPTKGYIFIENGSFSLDAKAKGIKSVHNILIQDGNFNLMTSDDAIHSDNFVGIVGGEININSGDDAIHANRELNVSGGDINVSYAYEGLEAQKVSINGGTIKLNTSDDGINAGGGADLSASGRPNAGPFDADEKCILSINDGNIYINSAGDGVDSNGWVYFNGGTVIIDGPTDDGNGALDAGMGIITNGGAVFAIGSSGMAENLGNTSTTDNVSIFLTDTMPAGTTITIKNSLSDTIVEHVSAKAFSHIAIALPEFKLGETYSLYLNDELYEDFTISGILTTIGNNGRNRMQPRR